MLAVLLEVPLLPFALLLETSGLVNHQHLMLFLDFYLFLNVELIPKPAPNGTIFYHSMLMPLHDSMPSFMNLRRVLYLLEFKN